MASKGENDLSELPEGVYKYLGRPIRDRSEAYKKAVELYPKKEQTSAQKKEQTSGQKKQQTRGQKKQPTAEQQNSRMVTRSSGSKQTKASELDGSPTPPTITPINPYPNPNHM